jgi:Family of unknown function (DUF6399)
MSSIVVACTHVFCPGSLNEPGLSPYGVFATRPPEIQAMTPSQLNPNTDSRPDTFRWNRADTAQALHDFDHSQQPHPSRRQFAQQAGIPHATLDYWLRLRQQQRDRHSDEPQVAAFLHSPAGERFLRRLVLAAHATFHQAGTCGIRDLGRFLCRAGLDGFVAASYGAQHGLAARLRTAVLAYGQAEQQRLAAAMPSKKIAACLDENFHGAQACLVAIEPASNFVLLEAYHDRRDADTWTAALKQSLHGLAVEVIAVTSDQAKGLIACAEEGLAAQHSPDLFHGQQQLTRATALALHRQTEAATEKLRHADEQVATLQRRQQDYEQQPRPGRPPDWPTAWRMAEALRRQATEQMAACQQRQERARQAVRGLGDDYHPFDRHSGRPLETAEVQQRLEQHVAAVEAVVTEASLGERGQQAVAKTRSWMVLLAATLNWYWAEVRRRIAELELPEAVERVVYERLLPGLYWRSAATRGRDAQQRQRLGQLAQRLLRRVRWDRGPLQRLTAEQQRQLQQVTQEAAELFVRSSSCVEGRNGRLALYHHGQGPLQPERLQALTVWHNYGSERADGTTAAERFFGAKPQPLFEWLLERMPELPRPAQKRKPCSQQPRSTDAAA